jgi:orotate phosphoribosyltransferase
MLQFHSSSSPVWAHGKKSTYFHKVKIATQFSQIINAALFALRLSKNNITHTLPGVLPVKAGKKAG